MSKKRIIVITLIILAVIAAGFAGYYFYFKKPPIKIEKTGKESQPSAQTPQNVVVINDKLKKISGAPAVSPAPSADGAKVIYAGKSGGIFETDFDGKETKETKFIPQQNLFRVLWSKDGSEFIAFYAAPDGRKLFYNNRTAQKTAPLDKDIIAVTAARADDKIAHLRADPARNTNAVVIADFNGENAKTVFNTRLADVRLDWINEKEIAVTAAPSGLSAGALWLLNISSQKLTATLSNIFGLTAKWADSGEQFLFSQTLSRGENLSLFVADKRGGNAKKMDIAALPEKCVFVSDGKTALCAAPETAPDIIWPDDYYKGLYSAKERIWSVNLATGAKTLLYAFPEGQAFDATNLILSSKGDALVFLNKTDGYLYSLKLK